MMALVILGREIQKKNQGHGPNPLSKDTIPHYQRITRVQAHARNDSVNGLIRRARNLILSIIIILHLMTILFRSLVELVIKWWQKVYR